MYSCDYRVLARSLQTTQILCPGTPIYQLHKIQLVTQFVWNDLLEQLTLTQHDISHSYHWLISGWHIQGQWIMYCPVHLLHVVWYHFPLERKLIDPTTAPLSVISHSVWTNNQCCHFTFCIRKSILPSIYPSIYPSIHLSSHLYIYPSIYHLSIYSPIHPSTHPPIHHPSIHLSIHLLDLKWSKTCLVQSGGCRFQYSNYVWKYQHTNKIYFASKLDIIVFFSARCLTSAVSGSIRGCYFTAGLFDIVLPSHSGPGLAGSAAAMPFYTKRTSSGFNWMAIRIHSG